MKTIYEVSFMFNEIYNLLKEVASKDEILSIFENVLGVVEEIYQLDLKDQNLKNAVLDEVIKILQDHKSK